MGMSGFKNPALSPLFITMTGGMIFVAAFCIRSLTCNPDVTWNNAETPQNQYAQKQFKVYNPRKIDFETQLQAPKY